jgi:hypothetical protein
LGATRAWRDFHSSEWRETAQVKRNIAKLLADQKRERLGRKRIRKQDTRSGGRIQNRI